MAVKGFKAIFVFDANAITIARKRTAPNDDTIKGCQDFIIGNGLDINTRMVASPAIRADDMTSRERISPLFFF